MREAKDGKDFEEVFRIWYTFLTRKLKEQIINVIGNDDCEYTVRVLAHELMCIAYWYGEISSGNFQHVDDFVGVYVEYSKKVV